MAQKKRGPGRPPGSKGKKTGKSQASSRSKSTIEQNVQRAQSRNEAKAKIKDEIVGLIIVALGVFLIVALQTHAAGVAGENIGKVLKGFFGLIAFFLPYCFIVYGVLLFLQKTIHTGIKSYIYLTIIYLMMVLINAGRFMQSIAEGGEFEGFSSAYADGISLRGGGVFGMWLGSIITKWIGVSGLYILSFLVIFICLLLLVNTPVSRFFENIKKRRERRLIEREERAKVKAAEEEERRRQYQAAASDPYVNSQPVSSRQRRVLDTLATEGPDSPDTPKPPARRFRRASDPFSVVAAETAEPASVQPSAPTIHTADPIEPAAASETPAEEKPKRKRKLSIKTADAVPPAEVPAAETSLKADDFIENVANENYEFPSIELLKKGKAGNTGESQAVLQEKAMQLEDTLRSFNVDANVTNVTQGPAVTRYEVHPNSGVKVKGIKSLADDIALNMKAKSIRIEAPIPGKDAVGIEIENEKISMVTVREIIGSEAFRTAQSKLTFIVGKDIAGKAIVADLKSMPHMLIAGSTGSGKSVCINSIITSILYKARPDEVKMVLIDPKVVELSNYNGIPHLLIPVVTDPGKAAAALNWAVAEMDDRYRKFAEAGARELSSYNEQIEARNQEALKKAGRNAGSGKAEEGGEGVTLEAKMPQVVIIIDELADLMMAAPSQVEESICRLAQKARAAGMHLIVATQRPSVDVITGLIKANIPSRIAFAVSSQVDSRTILDMGGAEKLVGKGDMLFNPLGTGKPTRVQGAFISDKEVHDVIEFVKTQAKADEEAANNVMESISKVNTPDAEKGNRDFEDELLPEAIELVVGAGQASVSMLQRRFRIGYNRAARIIDMMEDRQIVGPQDGSRPRQVLISEEDLQVLQEATEDMDE